MPDGTFQPEPGGKPEMIQASTTEAGNPPAHAIDGNEGTRWCASSGAGNQWLMLDLGRLEEVSALQILWEKSTDNPFSVEISGEGLNWQIARPKAPAEGASQRVPLSGKARYIRVSGDGSVGAWVSIRELVAVDTDGQAIQPRPAISEGKALAPEAHGFKDEDWRTLNLPHDWAIEGPFSMEIENETGKLPWEGIGWYRKSFEVPAELEGRRVYIDFDGAMSQARVYINGKLAGEWAYGYNSFRIDATPHLKFGADNTIAVRLENLPLSTRWYPGAGIYRHVWLVHSPQMHIAQWGNYVTTPEVTDARALISVETTIENHSGELHQLRLRAEVLDGGRVIASQEKALKLAVGNQTESLELSVDHPKRWDLKDPHLYTLRTSLLDGDQVTDQMETDFGIRTIEWHAEKGFLLNGEKVVLKGVCNHHDLGPLGSAVYKRAIERQIEILKEMGCNSIRTAHNPPAPELLELCDRMGILVINELFDIWKLQKYGKRNGYNIFWDDWHEKDVRNFLLRDRNHPSVIAWSMGNEVAELYNTNYHWVPQKLRKLMRQYDTTRPITAGSNSPAAATNGFQQTVDIYGVNYHLGSYPGLVKALPDKAIYASETSSTVSTRGEYFFPVDWNKSKGFYQFQVSSYDLYAPGWANRPDLQFEALDKHPRFAGEYVWTGFDYIGEPTPYNQDQSNALNFQNPEERDAYMNLLQELGNRAPSRSSYFGILDLCGFRKDRFYLYQARWRPKLPVAHILPHWNWPERVGEITPVHVYTNGDEAELFLNGRSLGKRRIGEPHPYRLTWDEVTYQPGRLEVVVQKDGKRWAQAVEETTGEAAKLDLTADRSRIAADGRDLAYLTIRVLDSENREVPRTRIPVHIRVSGPVEIAGIGNGDPTDHTVMKPGDPTRAMITAFNGRAQIIVRSKAGQPGSAKVEVATVELGRGEALIMLE